MTDLETEKDLSFNNLFGEQYAYLYYLMYKIILEHDKENKDDWRLTKVV